MKLQSAASVLALLSPLALASSAWKTDPSQKKNQSHDIAPRHTTTSSELESIGNILAVPIEDYSEGSSKSTRRDLSRFTIPSYSWTQLGNDIESTIQQANDWFGYFVSISADGRTVAASAYNCYGYDDQGHVEVHTYDADTDQWVKLGQSIPTVPGASDDFGYSISLSPDGTTLAIGARDSNDAGNRQGRATVYRYDAGLASWEVMGNVIYGEAEFDEFGESVSLSQNGEILAVGAKYNDGNGDDSGHVRIYRFNSKSDAWEKIGDDIDGENPGDKAGSSVSLSFDGQTVAVGAKDNNNDFGHVRVFGLDANDNWVQIGQDIDGDTSNYYAGDRYISLAGEGHTVAFSSVYNGGLIQIYRLNSSSNQWEKLGNDIPGGANQDEGYALQLSADGNTLAVGHSYYDNDTGYTEMYRYDQTRNIWKPMGLTIDGEQVGEYSGWSVSLAADGKTVVVGDSEHQVNGLAGAGRLRVFELNSYFCGSNMEEFRGHRIYFRGEDPRDSVQKCFMIEAVDGGLFAANNNDEACKNVHEYEVTEEISNVRMIKNGRVEMEATSQFSEWNGKVILREKPNKMRGSMRPRFEFDWKNMEFKIVLKVSSCPVVS